MPAQTPSSPEGMTATHRPRLSASELWWGWMGVAWVILLLLCVAAILLDLEDLRAALAPIRLV